MKSEKELLREIIELDEKIGARMHSKILAFYKGKSKEEIKLG